MRVHERSAVDAYLADVPGLVGVETEADHGVGPAARRGRVHAVLEAVQHDRLRDARRAGVPSALLGGGAHRSVGRRRGEELERHEHLVHVAIHQLQGQHKNTSFKVSCGRQWCDLGAVLGIRSTEDPAP